MAGEESAEDFGARLVRDMEPSMNKVERVLKQSSLLLFEEVPAKKQD